MQWGEGEKAEETRCRAGVQSSDGWNGAVGISCAGGGGALVRKGGWRARWAVLYTGSDKGNEDSWGRSHGGLAVAVAVAVAVRGSEATMMQTRPRIGGDAAQNLGDAMFKPHAHHAKLRMPLLLVNDKELYLKKHNVYRSSTHSIAIVHDIPTVIQPPTQQLLPVFKRDPSSFPSPQTPSAGLRENLLSTPQGHARLLFIKPSLQEHLIREIGEDEASSSTDKTIKALHRRGLKIIDPSLSGGMNRRKLSRDLITANRHIWSDLLCVLQHIHKPHSRLDHDRISTLIQISLDAAASETTTGHRELVAFTVTKRGSRAGSLITQISICAERNEEADSTNHL